MEGRRTAPTYLDYRTNTTTTTTISPPQHSPNRPPPPPPPPQSTQSPTPNTLLIYISGGASPNMHVFLTTILSRYSIAEAYIVAHSDASLKTARMDLYTAAGKLRQDIGVSTTRVEGAVLRAGELGDVVQKLEAKTLSGVLCCQHLENERSGSRTTLESRNGSEVERVTRDVLDYDELELEDSWRMNILTIHTLARATVPLLRRAPLHPSPFFCLDTTLPLAPLDTVAQATLLHHLSSSPASQGLRFGLASEELIPASPVPVTPSEEAGTLRLRIPGDDGYGYDNGYFNKNGYGNGSGGQNGRYEPQPSPMGESPTKLWASWAMMNE